MKKITTSLFIIALFLFSGRVANAQLADGCIAPDFTGTDINGQSWHLYDLLDQGKTVFMDVSATWCGPCWNYHISGNLENLYNSYGPPGTNEAMVLFIEGDGSTNTACLTSAAGCNSSTQGNWIAGTPYPIIDDATIASAYQISYFPTIYMITPDRICRENSQITTAQHFAAMNAKRILSIPTADAGLDYGCGQNLSLASCTGVNMTVRLFNYSDLGMTSATITVTVDGVLQQTIPWTGNLTTYSYANVNITNVTGAAGARTAVISVTGVNGGADTRSTNNTTNVPFTIYSTTGGGAVSANFQGSIPASFSILNGGAAATWAYNSAGYNSVGSAKIDFFSIASGEVDAMLLPPMNFVGYDNANVTFERAHKRYSASYSDKLMVKASANCGTTWLSLYNKSGATLASVTGYATTAWTPATAADWAADQVVLNSMLNNSAVLLKFEGTSGYGNNLYLDDINVNLSVGVNNVADYVQFSVYPNPATEKLTVQLSLKQSEKATMEIVNTLGEVVASQSSSLNAGESTVDFNVKDLASGSYFISVATAEGKVVKPFMVQ
ncbi:hypothetical protein BH11BAC1_BH11BAC1_13920 [soil metagenome]